METNIDGGVEITSINEGKNMITLMYTDQQMVFDEDYKIEKYKFYWEEDGEEKVIVDRDDGLTVFSRHSMQVDFELPEGLRLVDNTDKVIAYEVLMKAQKTGLEDKIIKGQINKVYAEEADGHGADNCLKAEYG